MRLWSIHPKYLDRQGLLAIWREGLLAQKVLQRKTKGYKNHPQLERFKNIPENLGTLAIYLWEIYSEGRRRGYNFDDRKISKRTAIIKKLRITKGQLEYEFKHLQRKLHNRDREKFWENHNLVYSKMNPFYMISDIRPNPIFDVIEGDIESWEKIKK